MNYIIKKFYKEVKVKKEEGGYNLYLDNTLLKSPKKKSLDIRSKILAEKIKQEFTNIEGDIIDLNQLFITKLYYTYKDFYEGNKENKEASIKQYKSFFDSDLLIYLDNKEELKEQQVKYNQKLINRFEEILNIEKVNFANNLFDKVTTKGQKEKLEDYIRKSGEEVYPYLNEMCEQTNSCIIAVLALNRKITLEEIMEVIFAEEDFNAKYFGVLDSLKEEKINKKEVIKKILEVIEFLN